MLVFTFSVQVGHECVLSCIAYGESVRMVLRVWTDEVVGVGVAWRGGEGEREENGFLSSFCSNSL